MKRTSKIVLVTIIIIVIIVIGRYFYERHMLQQEYVNAVEQKEKEYIDSFYHTNFSGVITYIKTYEKNQNKYVIGVIDSTNNERTIGKVEITNFSNVMEGDSVRKKSNSFELEIIGQKGKTLSLVKYE